MVRPREENGWSSVGRGGSVRPRDQRSPPVKKVDNRYSPTSNRANPEVVEISPNKFAPLDPEGEGLGEGGERKQDL
jgi:hypothetical protein